MQKKRPDSDDTIARAITELRALERYTIEALEVQEYEDDLASHEEAAKLIAQTVVVLRRHVACLDLRIAARVQTTEALRIATTSMASAFLCFLSKIRSHDTSKILRDDYTLLTLASIGYVMLHTTALALRQNDLAEMAIRHHQELTPLVQEIALILPHLVLQDLSRDFRGLNEHAADATVLVAAETLVPDSPWATALA